MNNPLLVLFHNRQFQAIAGIQVFNVFSAQLLAPILPLYLTSQGLSLANRPWLWELPLLALIMRPSAVAQSTGAAAAVILFGSRFLQYVCPPILGSLDSCHYY